MQTMMSNSHFATSGQPAQAAYTELSDLAKVRRQSKHDPAEAMQKVARQFESLFLKMMLKSMRQASFGNPLFDSSQTDLYRDMFDDQIALDMANGRGIGLADALMKQLSHYTNAREDNSEDAAAIGSFQSKDAVETVKGGTTPEGNAKAVSFGELPRMDLSRVIPANNVESLHTDNEVYEMRGKTMPMNFENPEHFIHKMLPMAQAAAEELGVSPRVLIAQAALETGWGKAVSQHQDGRSSHNLFNIKADNRWAGESLSKSTLEFDQGVAKRQVAKFRAYDSYAESFKDYVQFLKSNPRYQSALDSVGDTEEFVSGLQQAGYATDPRYAEKIMDILKRDAMQVSMFENQEQING